MQFRNALLSSFNGADMAALSPFLVEMRLAKDAPLYAVGDRVEHIYFPTTAILAVVSVMDDGKEVEGATIGHESAGGLVAGLSQLPTVSRSFVQVGGSAFRLPAEKLRRRMMSSETLFGCVLRHIDLITANGEQIAACNAVHPVRARLARCLLMMLDRTEDDRINVTQEELAVMLGAQRTTINDHATALKSAGIMTYHRGLLRVIDRPALQREACECYAVGRNRLAALACC